jgi:hypothetical protein
VPEKSLGHRAATDVPVQTNRMVFIPAASSCVLVRSVASRNVAGPRSSDADFRVARRQGRPARRLEAGADREPSRPIHTGRDALRKGPGHFLGDLAGSGGELAKAAWSMSAAESQPGFVPRLRGRRRTHRTRARGPDRFGFGIAGAQR